MPRFSPAMAKLASAKIKAEAALVGDTLGERRARNTCKTGALPNTKSDVA